MSFLSPAFAILFLVALLARFIFGRESCERPYFVVLGGLSLVFYAWHVPPYLAILLLSTIVDYSAARLLHPLPAGSRKRRLLLIASLVTNLGLLGIFKYLGFFVRMADDLANLLGVGPFGARQLDLLLPMGISFYTFQSMSYTIGVYRGEFEPVRSFGRLLLFVAFFPQLVAGPIVRAGQFLYQLNRKRRIRARVFAEGTFLIIRGFFLKLVIADNIAPVVEQNWGSLGDGSVSSLVPWLVTFLFSCQIYCDFAGYSSIARGLAYLLGFRLPVNFRHPYIAGSFQEFWTRWHITLSQWLRDFLYIPLGGNRISARRTLINLMLVMLLGGLWHGAAWNFVIWGALHGSALIVERLLRTTERAKRSLALKVAWFLVVQIVVLLTWVAFRSISLDQTLAILGNMLLPHGGELGDPGILLALALTLPVVFSHLRAGLAERGVLPKFSTSDQAIWAGVMLYLILTCYGQSSDFIYFQF